VLLIEDLQPSNVLVGANDVLVSADPENSGIADPKASYNVLNSRPLPVADPSNHEEMIVKIADLGMGNWIDNHWLELIQSPSLRAPEVMLGGPWDTSADVWSWGCIVVYLGYCKTNFPDI
jgi:serine/threonine-protein kinase SRPK3